jgi:asparagine synthase (glutamine-hydrolysing)
VGVQYGIWNFEGKPIDSECLDEARTLLAPYAPDGFSCHVDQSIALLYGAFHTTPESRRETQPYVSPSGAIWTWDGRLDNELALIESMGDSLPRELPDVEIAEACYRNWGFDCFGELIGDWALTIWDRKQRTLILAKDFAGTRHLYYRIEKDKVTWSTILAPLLHPSKGTFSLNREYLAGCLSFLPAPHLTPYVEVSSVPPSSYVVLKDRRATTRRYWDFDPGKTIRYPRDSEYEEHFVDVFREAVRRRLRSDRPILAELSGGMDSSSIVCVADDLISSGNALPSSLDIISYYSSFEPDWDEQPYFTKVEERRGGAGSHIDLGPCGFFEFRFDSDRVAVTPGNGPETAPGRQIAERIRSGGNRVVLSGLGGDEVMGGVPTAIPELSDLLASARISRLAHQLKTWALAQRKPWLHLFAEVCRDFLPANLRGRPDFQKPAPWVHPSFRSRYRKALEGYPSRIRLSGPLPSFQYNMSAVEGLRRTLAWLPTSPGHLCEKRYPYLDRSLLEFLFAIPREQLVRPGQRRSLMRRAMRGIVPEEVIARKRKAFVSRAPRTAIATEWNHLAGEGQHFVTASLGIVDEERLVEAMNGARLGREVALVPLVRTISLECWLRHLATHKVSSDLRTSNQHQSGFLGRDSHKEKGGEIS